MTVPRKRWPWYYEGDKSWQTPLDVAWDAYLFRAIMAASGINPDDYPSLCPGHYLAAFERGLDELSPESYRKVVGLQFDEVLQVRLTDELIEWFVRYVKEIYNDHCEASFWANVPG